MALTPSNMLALGTNLPMFALPDPSMAKGQLVRSSDFKGSKALLVMFICNHCPYVKHIREQLSVMAAEYIAMGVAVVAINSNDAEKYPDDSPAKMVVEKKTYNYQFPYLFDETQAVARSFNAACTPEFYLFDSSQKLVYRGQMDDSRPGNQTPVTGRDLRAAMDAVLIGKSPSLDQKPSIGCNIKWR